MNNTIWNKIISVSSFKEFPNPSTNTIDEEECIICFDQPMIMIASPCAHKFACILCAIKIKENDSRCPLCRTYIDSLINTNIYIDDDSIFIQLLNKDTLIPQDSYNNPEHTVGGGLRLDEMERDVLHSQFMFGSEMLEVD